MFDGAWSFTLAEIQLEENDHGVATFNSALARGIPTFE
jgi:hypothetical protein